MRPRDERAHPVVRHALDRGYLGTGVPYVVPGFTTFAAADEGRRSINNAARHLGVSCSSRKKDHIVAEPDGTFSVHFRLYPKSAGRAHVHAQAAGDPSNLAYNPFRRAEKRAFDDDGNRL